MKNLYNLNSKSYKEGYDILHLLSSDIQKKIPENIWQFIEENMDVNHKITFEDIRRNNLLEDTNLLLAIIYKAYLATEEEKIVICAKENAIKRQKEQIAYEKYNPNNLFKK